MTLPRDETEISLVERRLAGTPRTRFMEELFGNSIHFPIANALFELLSHGMVYLGRPGVYTMVLAACVQALVLVRVPARSFFWVLMGNLVGCAIYTASDILVEGSDYVANWPNHWAYWGFSFLIGLWRGLCVLPVPRWLHAGVIVIEEVTRAAMLVVMYMLFELDAEDMWGGSVAAFFSDASHLFYAWAAFLLGLSLGIRRVLAGRSLDLLRETSDRLRVYSEWLLGREFLDRLVADSDALSLQRRDRTILFVDIRGFTGWAEAAQPEEVVELLDRYYRLAEETLVRHQSLKLKLSGDEVMAVFAHPGDATAAARELRGLLREAFAPAGLEIAMGIHAGPVIEGLLGGTRVRFFDVIGDTVNVAKRIEQLAEPGEVLLSEDCARQAAEPLPLLSSRTVLLKGKGVPISVTTLGS
jgi:class 3 adenylate cyclase